MSLDFLEMEKRETTGSFSTPESSKVFDVHLHQACLVFGLVLLREPIKCTANQMVLLMRQNPFSKCKHFVLISFDCSTLWGPDLAVNTYGNEGFRVVQAITGHCVANGHVIQKEMGSGLSAQAC